MRTLKSLAFLSFFAIVLGGCASPVTGTWQSREKLSNKERNRLIVSDDGTASLKMYAKLAPSAALTKIKFEGTWLDDVDEYEFELKCDSGCPSGSSIDFRMDCVLGENETLDCDARAPFQDYGHFEFEPISE